LRRAKRTRAHERRGAAAASPTAAAATRVEARTASSDLRLRAAGRRAGAAKAALGAVGALVFGAAMLFARVSYAGHPKRPPRPLAAPPRFVEVVRENLLQAGIVAPAEAPPGAATSVS
jgi:hypothetical protein